MRYIAYCTKGLEEIVEKELRSVLPIAHIIEQGDKRILFESDAKLEDITRLRTVDDIGIILHEIENFSSTDQLIVALKTSDLNSLREFLQTFRNIDNTFSITTSVMGNKNLYPQKIKGTASTYIADTYGWKYTETDHTNFDVRIFIDKTIGIISVRITSESLHHRSYKFQSRAGSLRPTVAAAMVLLATKGEKYKKIVDNFCGSGTILCEAKSIGNDVFGGDIEPESVHMTKENLVNIQFTNEDSIKLLNATHTNWPDDYFDCAVSNFPWDKQVKVVSITDLYRGSLEEYKRIVKPHGSFCFLVSKPELFLKYAKKTFPDKHFKTIKIGLLGQNPTIVVST